MVIRPVLLRMVVIIVANMENFHMLSTVVNVKPHLILTIIL